MARGLKRSLLKDIGKPGSDSHEESTAMDESAVAATPAAFKRASAGAGSAFGDAPFRR